MVLGYTGSSKSTSIREPKRRRKESEYGMQLREKQKVKVHLRRLEKQFHGYYERAKSMPGVTGENLMRILESRLDNVIFRLGFARTRKEARQIVTHGHITVNGKRVDIPSYRVRPGDLVAVAPKSKDLLVIKSALVSNARSRCLHGLRLISRSFRAACWLSRNAIKSIWTFANSSSSNSTRSNRARSKEAYTA